MTRKKKINGPVYDSASWTGIYEDRMPFDDLIKMYWDRLISLIWRK